MAEKYGTIPKRFTSAWFDYVWTYYKWHIIIPIVIIVFAMVTLYQCTHRTQYDCTVYYAGEKVFSEKQVQLIEAEAAKYIDDVNGDGEKLFDFQQINFQNTAGTEEMDYNLQLKLDLQLHTHSTYIFLFDKNEADLMFSRDGTDMTYLPVDEWADTAPSEDRLYKKDGTAYAVYIGESENVKNIGINTDDLYLTLCRNNDDKPEEEYANYIRFANYLID